MTVGLSVLGLKVDLVARIATANVGNTEDSKEGGHSGVFRDSSPTLTTRLDAVVFSIDTTVSVL